MEKIHLIFLRSIVGNDPSFKDKERAKFLAEFNKENDFEFIDSGRDFFFIETGGTEEQFKRIFEQYKEPYNIIATNANNSLPASLEIATFLKNNNKRFNLFHGTPLEVKKQILNQKEYKIVENCSRFSKKDILHNQRFGVIGKPSDWLIASEVDYKEVNEKLGCEIIDISIDKLIEKFNKKSSSILGNKFDKYINEKVSKKTLEDALKIYDSLKEIIVENKLDGITIRCFDLLGILHNTSCLALALLNSEGYIATCEGDVPAMLTMAMIKTLFSKSSFQVNPSYINVKEKYAYFAHCTLPFDMCESFSFDTHFESGIGVGIKGELCCDEITIFKINKDLENYEIFEGKIERNLRLENLCRTQIKVKFKDEINNIISSPNGNHLVIFYGHFKKQLIKILS